MENKEKKISWLQYQLGEKWFLIAAIFMLAGLFFWNREDYGGIYSGIGLTILGWFVVGYGGVKQWLNYKKGKNT